MIKRRKLEFSQAVFVFILTLAMMATFLPLYYIAINSISNGKYVLSGQVTLWPKGINIEPYRVILGDKLFLRSYANTIVYTLTGTIINLVLTTLCAYPLSIGKLFGHKFFTLMIVFTMLFNGGIIPRYLMMHQFNMIDTIWAIVLPGAINTWNMIILRTYFSGIDSGVRESALIDGANDFVILLRIIVPLCVPVYAALTIFYMVGHWNSYFGALIYLNDRTKYPLQLILRNMTVEGNLTDFNQSMGSENDFFVMEQNLKYAAIMVATLPIVMIYPFVQKYFVKGIMVGSIKG